MKADLGVNQQLGIDAVRNEMDRFALPRQIARQVEISQVHAAGLHEIATHQQKGRGSAWRWEVHRSRGGHTAISGLEVSEAERRRAIVWRRSKRSR